MLSDHVDLCAQKNFLEKIANQKKREGERK